MQHKLSVTMATSTRPVTSVTWPVILCLMYLKSRYWELWNTVMLQGSWLKRLVCVEPCRQVRRGGGKSGLGMRLSIHETVNCVNPIILHVFLSLSMILGVHDSSYSCNIIPLLLEIWRHFVCPCWSSGSNGWLFLSRQQPWRSHEDTKTVDIPVRSQDGISCTLCSNMIFDPLHRSVTVPIKSLTLLMEATHRLQNVDLAAQVSQGLVTNTGDLVCVFNSFKAS